LTEEKVEKIVTLGNIILRKREITVRTFASFIGLVIYSSTDHLPPVVWPLKFDSHPSNEASHSNQQSTGLGLIGLPFNFLIFEIHHLISYTENCESLNLQS
jgi:hypothetical protein